MTAERKRRLHAWLDRVQGWTPGPARAAVRPLYLNLFYKRTFPEYNQPTGPPAAFAEYKAQLQRTLPMDLSGFGCESRQGLVSVVLPVYNGARYLAESIKSVLSQTLRDLELIVVDDGSTDDTPAILARYAKDARVRCIRQENRKLPAALNAGFAVARGEFFTWTSADNAMRPEMLERLRAFLQARRNVEMVYADEELMDELGRPALGTDFCRTYQNPEGSNVLARPHDTGRLNFGRDNFIGGCFLYRAWAGRAVGQYCEEAFGFEDYDYWLRMNALFRIAHFGETRPLHRYRLHAESLTARAAELAIAERTRYWLAIEEERRRWYAGGFDIEFTGWHPWFESLAEAYRDAGHNVVRQGVRVFGKRIGIAAGPAPGAFAMLEGRRVRAAGCEWRAESAEALAYPLLAITNAYFSRRNVPNASGT